MTENPSVPPAEGQPSAPGAPGVPVVDSAPLLVWREELFAASNGARIIHRVPLGEPPAGFIPFSGQGDLVVMLPDGRQLPPRPIFFPLPGAPDARSAAELWPAASEAAAQAEIAQVKQAIEEFKQQQQSGIVLAGPGAIPPGLAGHKDFPPARRNGRGPRLVT
jgi:hypothetical protein